MGRRREDLTPEQFARRDAYDRSLESVRQLRADPEKMAWLREQLRRLDDRPAAPRMTKEEFLAALEG